MSLNFHKLKSERYPQATLTVDQLIDKLDCHPLGSQHSEQLKHDARGIVRESLKLLVPDIDELEKNPDQSQLKFKIAEGIESKIKNIAIDDLKKIAGAIGLDPNRYDNNQQLIKALTAKLRDNLYEPADLAKALDTLSAGDLLNKINPQQAPGVLEKLKKFLRSCTELLELLIDISQPPLIPLAPLLKPDNQTFFAAEPGAPTTDRSSNNVIIIRDAGREDKKPSSILQIYAAACEEVANATDKEKRKDLAEEQNEQETSEESKREAVTEFLSENSEFAESLGGLVNDISFTDGPLSAGRKFAALALARSKKEKLH